MKIRRKYFFPFFCGLIGVLSPPLNVLGSEEQGVLLRWSQTKGSLQYELEISKYPELNNLLLKKTVPGVEYYIKLPPGIYYYRVRGIHPLGTTGPWSDVAKTEIKTAIAQQSKPSGEPNIRPKESIEKLPPVNLAAMKSDPPKFFVLPQLRVTSFAYDQTDTQHFSQLVGVGELVFRYLLFMNVLQVHGMAYSTIHVFSSNQKDLTLWSYGVRPGVSFEFPWMQPPFHLAFGISGSMSAARSKHTQLGGNDFGYRLVGLVLHPEITAKLSPRQRASILLRYSPFGTGATTSRSFFSSIRANRELGLRTNWILVLNTKKGWEHSIHFMFEGSTLNAELSDSQSVNLKTYGVGVGLGMGF